jgi:enediyne biosynthesis protein E4
VRVKAGGQTWTQWNDGKSGYLSQSRMPLYFGLGDAAKVDSIEVLWPSGKTQTVQNPKPGTQIEIVEK